MGLKRLKLTLKRGKSCECDRHLFQMRKRNSISSASAIAFFLKTFFSGARRFLASFVAISCLFFFSCANANAEIIDRIDVKPHEHDADIVIRFSQKILYQRYAPLIDGKELRIFIRLTDPTISESNLDQEVAHSFKTDRVPDVTVIYPELINGMLVRFSQSTQYSVRPGADGQSIVIAVPLLPAPIAPKGVISTSVPSASDKAAAVAVAASPAPATPPTPPVAQTKAATESHPTETVAAAGKEETAPSAVPQTMSSAEIEAHAKTFLDQAHKAMEEKDAATAINRLNRVLSMPTNAQTENAQALIGEAREMNGEIAKARAEYQLYLKLFPAGSKAERVRTRLAALPKDSAQSRTASRAAQKFTGPAQWTYNGSVSSYYYRGNSQIETLVPPPPGQLVFNRDTLSLVDQDSWINSVNLNARRRDGSTDTRIVVRDTDNHNYLSPMYSYNRLYSAYVDHTNIEYGYNVRFGRQNPTGMGVLDRFDGIQGGYFLNPDWKVNGVIGEAVEYGSPYKKKFYGASVDLLPQTSRPGVSIYAIQQTLDGLENRRAVGSEMRYFDGGASAYGMLDYDVLYKGINIALIQGNYLSSGGDNYYFVLDHRKAPTLSLTTALLAFPGMTLSDMINYQGIDQVRLQVNALSATSDMLAIGVTHPLTERWQLGVDYRLSSISSTRDVMAVLPLAVIGTCLGTIDTVNNNCIVDTASQQGSGLNHVVTFQAIGTNLFATNAVGAANLSLIKAPTYSGEASSLDYVFPFWDQFRLDTNLRYYNQKDDSDNKQDRLSYSLRLSRQWRANFFLEGEVGREISNSSGIIRNDHSVRNYIYVGVRGDVQ